MTQTTRSPPVTADVQGYVWPTWAIGVTLAAALILLFLIVLGVVLVSDDINTCISI